MINFISVHFILDITKILAKTKYACTKYKTNSNQHNSQNCNNYYKISSLTFLIYHFQSLIIYHPTPIAIKTIISKTINITENIPLNFISKGLGQAFPVTLSISVLQVLQVSPKSITLLPHLVSSYSPSEGGTYSLFFKQIFSP